MWLFQLIYSSIIKGCDECLRGRQWAVSFLNFTDNFFSRTSSDLNTYLIFPRPYFFFYFLLTKFSSSNYLLNICLFIYRHSPYLRPYIFLLGSLQGIIEQLFIGGKWAVIRPITLTPISSFLQELQKQSWEADLGSLFFKFDSVPQWKDVFQPFLNNVEYSQLEERPGSFILFKMPI